MSAKHSREFYLIGIERDTLALAGELPADTRRVIESRLDEYRLALAEYDRPGRRNKTLADGVEIVKGAAVQPGGVAWLDEWIDLARPWLTLHKMNGHGFRVRLLEGAPLERLASETRIKITRRDTATEIHNDVTLPKTARAYVIRKVQAGA
jgi:hypothetical protein